MNNDDDEAADALTFAHQFIASDLSAIDLQILGKFDISKVDPTTFQRYKGRYADVRAFTEQACKDDASIEGDFKAALSKQSLERAAALHTLLAKLGTNSHRQQQLGDMML